MIVLCRKERYQFFKPRDDWFPKAILLIQCANLGLGCLLFIVAGIEDRGAILRPDIISLAIELSGVVCVEEDVEQFVVADFFRIVSDPNDLCVASISGTHSTVVSRLARSAGVPAGYIQDAIELLESCLGAPKAAACENCGTSTGHINFDGVAKIGEVMLQLPLSATGSASLATSS